MKTFWKFIGIVMLGGLGLMEWNSQAAVEVGASVQINAKADFTAPLAPHGMWVEVGSHGRCWRPAGVAVEWRPYCSGYWVWTDCGWYWESDEPWAWACYHYGYWVYDDTYGWVWIPDVEWSPAWVSWRVGGGFIGWAPLPPPGFVSVRVVEPRFFVFVETRRFTDPIRPTSVRVNDVAIIKQTTVINNVRRVDRTFEGSTSRKVIVNEGPGVGVVQKATGRQLDAVPIRDAAAKTRMPSASPRRVEEKGNIKTEPTPTPPANAVTPEKPDKLEKPKMPVTPAQPNPPAQPGNSKDRTITPPPQGPGSGPPPNLPRGNPFGPPNKGQGNGKEKGKDRF